MKKVLMILLFGFISAMLVPSIYGDIEEGYYTLGYTGTGNGYESTNSLYYHNYSLAVQDGYTAVLTEFHGYMTNSTGGVHAQFGVYSIGGVLIWKSAEFLVDATEWNKIPIEDVRLLSGTYILAVAMDDGARTFIDTTITNERRYIGTNSIPDTLLGNDYYDTNTEAIHVHYNLESLGVAEVSVSQTSVGQLVVLLFLLALNVLLIFKGNVPVLNMVVGIVGFALVASSLGGILFPFPWYMTILLALTSMLVVLRAGMSLRGT